VTRYLPLIVGVLAAAICARLGVWQLDRLGQRRARNVVQAAQLSELPMLLDAATARSALTEGAEPLRFRKVTARGRYDFDRELVVIGRSDNGRSGVHVVTPLLVDDSLAVFVERGWLPAADGWNYDTTGAGEPEDAAVSGVLLQAPARTVAFDGAVTWPVHVVSPDPTSVASHFPYAVLPLVLRRTSVPERTAFRVVAVPEPSDGPHLSYALQWFGFAVIALVGSTILYARRRRGTDAGGQPDPA
jgi:surfeit locus 1 family protein